jgi:hypothetical protein
MGAPRIAIDVCMFMGVCNSTIKSMSSETKDATMKQTKASPTLQSRLGAAVLASMLGACGGGGGGDSSLGLADSVNAPQVPQVPQTVAPDYGKLTAANIILAKGVPGKSGIVKIQASDLPSNVQVMASQVSVVNQNNSLRSVDLQTALDEELAVDIATNIVGVWDVKNYTAYSIFNYPETAVGQVEFKADGTYTVISGGFAVAGKVAIGTPGWATTNSYGNSKICVSPQAVTYEIVDGAVFFRAEGRGDGLTSVAKNTKDSITLVGSAGCQLSGNHLSRLTRVGSTPAPKAQPVMTNGVPRHKA